VISIPAYYSAEQLPSQSDIVVEFSKSQGDNFVVTNFKPIIYVNGEVRLLKSFTIHVTSSPNYTATTRTTSFAASSVLATGTWYKVGVSATGLHKIDAAFLTSLGVTISGLNPAHINIYGNHFPKLPTENITYRPDDLLKNSIYIEGEGDGSFDASDYILFYATGPDEVKAGASDFIASKNKIDSLSYYFIHIDASDSPKRIGSTSNSVSSVTHSVNTCNDFYLHELNEVNLLKSGDGWLGEHFDIELSKSFNADLGSVVSGTDITMKTAIGSNVVSGTGSLQIMVNGVQRDLIACPPLFGSYVEAKWTTSTTTFQSNTPMLNFVLNFSRSSAASEAWLDYILLNYQRNLSVGSKQFLIRNFASVGAGNTCQYSVSGASSALQIWEVTDPSNASKISGSLSGSMFHFFSKFRFTQNVCLFYSFASIYSCCDWFGCQSESARIGSGRLHYCDS
jgi:hypothetical protein